MTLRKKFRLLALAGLLVAVAAGALAVRSGLRVLEDLDRVAAVDELVDDLFDLGALASEADTDPTSRFRAQWSAALASVRAGLARLPGMEDPEGARIQEELDAIDLLVGRLHEVEGDEVASARGDRDRLESVLQTRIQGALRTTLEVAERRYDTLYAQMSGDILTLGIETLLAFGLLVLLGGLNTLHLDRSVLAPMAALGGAMTRVESGDRTVRLDWTREDELGVVARSFDRMTGRLVEEVEEHESTADALRASEERMRSILENLPDPVIRLDRDLRYLYVNPACTTYMDRSPGEMEGRTRRAAGFGRKGNEDPFGRAMRRVLETGEEARLTERLETPRGRRWFEARLVPEWNGSETPASVLMIARDVTRQREDADRLRDYYRAVQEAREEERVRIAREIHDDLGSLLTGLRLDLRQLRRKAKDDPRIREDLESLDDLVGTTIRTARRLATELRPGVLDELGLVAGLEWLCQRRTEQGDLPCLFQASHEEVEMERQRAIHLYRIVQEALTNVQRHARATRADVRLERDDESLTVEIVDDGVGLPAHAEKESAGLGLTHMRERAQMLGGTLELAGHREKGTMVRVSVPHRVAEEDVP